jgi:hypothetical protein
VVAVEAAVAAAVEAAALRVLQLRARLGPEPPVLRRVVAVAHAAVEAAGLRRASPLNRTNGRPWENAAVRCFRPVELRFFRLNSEDHGRR